MTLPKRIPISAAKKFCEEQNLRHVIICAGDGKLSHVVTYGRTIEDCAQAGEGGNRVKLLLGWPLCLQSEPNRVKKLRASLRFRMANKILDVASEIVVMAPAYGCSAKGTHRIQAKLAELVEAIRGTQP
jgi:hypothetical protein